MCVYGGFEQVIPSDLRERDRQVSRELMLEARSPAHLPACLRGPCLVVRNAYMRAGMALHEDGTTG